MKETTALFNEWCDAERTARKAMKTSLLSACEPPLQSSAAAVIASELQVKASALLERYLQAVSRHSQSLDAESFMRSLPPLDDDFLA